MTNNEYSFLSIELNKKEIYESLCNKLNSLCDDSNYRFIQMKIKKNFNDKFFNSEREKKIKLYLKYKKISTKSKDENHNVIETCSQYDKFNFNKLKGKKTKIRKKNYEALIVSCSSEAKSLIDQTLNVIDEFKRPIYVKNIDIESFLFNEKKNDYDNINTKLLYIRPTHVNNQNKIKSNFLVYIDNSYDKVNEENPSTQQSSKALFVELDNFVWWLDSKYVNLSK